MLSIDHSGLVTAKRWVRVYGWRKLRAYGEGVRHDNDYKV